jgi:hypothetical protein
MSAGRALAMADEQIAELVRVLSSAGEAGLRRPCPGREKLGDGTVGAVAMHTAENYTRISSFLRATIDGRPKEHLGAHHPGAMTGDVSLDDLLARLRRARRDLEVLTQLSDEELEDVPTASEIRFVDGRRTRGAILVAVLRHQQHQVDAIAAALA